MELHAGIDVGGTKTHAIVIDDDQVVRGEAILRTGRGEEQVLASIRAAIAGALAEAGAADASGRGLRTVGVGIPGVIDHERGVVANAVNLGVTRLPLADELARELGVAVTVENDVKSAARGAVAHFDASEATLTLLNVGTGIAASTFVNGTLWRGGRGVAGEIGHIPIISGGALCGCGQRGCIETISSGAGLIERWREVAPEATLADFDVAVADGDPRAREIFEQLAFGLVTALSTIALAYDSDIVVLAGGVIANRVGLLDTLLETLAERSAQSPFVASLDLASRIRVAPTDVPIAPLGAALFAQEATTVKVNAVRND